MIEKLDHSNKEIALQIKHVFQQSYAVEAQILNAVDNFPPLKRPLSAYLETDTIFIGYFINEELAGVIEVKFENEITDIHSLVVHPDYFRRGIASKLLNYIISDSKSPIFIVETGAANEPAIALYERMGFKKVKQWMTEVGIEKVQLKKGS